MSSADVPQELLSKISKGDCAVFVGAGLSALAGLPRWDGLLTDLLQNYCGDQVDADEKGTLFNLINSGRLIDVADFIRSSVKPRIFRDALVRILDPGNIHPTEAHRTLARMPFCGVVTTNYDHLLEDAYSQERGARSGRAYTFANLSVLPTLVSEKRFFILKAHGTVEDPDNIVFSRTDYQRVMFNSPAYRSFLSSLFASRTFLFLGYSLADPDLTMILEDLATVYKGFGQVHYAPMSDPGRVERTLFEKRFGIEMITYNPSTEHHSEIQDFIGSLSLSVERERAKLQEEELSRLHAQKMEAIDNLAAGITHEFNNMLTTIMGLGGLISMGMSPKDPNARHMEQLLMTVRRAGKLTGALRDFARKGGDSIDAFPLHRAVRFLSRFVQASQARRIDVQADLDEGCIIDGDRGQIEQLFLNLVVNARDAMADGGLLRVAIKSIQLDQETSGLVQRLSPGSYVLLEVADSGVGMADGVRQRIFEPFFTAREGGLGLGLAVVHGIAKRHGADIEVESTPGKGTTFRVYFPRSRKTVIDTEKAALPPSASVGRGQRILVIDDEPLITEATVELLNRLGYAARGFVGGEEALAFCKRPGERIDLVLLDAVMPAVSGEEILRALRRTHPETQVMAMSGLPREALEDSLGFADLDFLDKPVDARHLALAVARALNQRKRRPSGGGRRSKASSPRPR